MFLSNWLVFKIVLAAVTGLVDYPLAADVLLVYDNANKLYLSGGSLEYVSNVVLYKGETSYEIEGPNVIAGDEQKITASDKAADDYFGTSVSLSGDYAIVGANGKDTFVGAAYIYTRNGTTWSQQQKIEAIDIGAGDRFGHSVSLSGDYAIVGAQRGDTGGTGGAGAAYIYTRNASTGQWGDEQKIYASDKASNDFFGTSVSIDGDYAIVGANNKNSATGAAYIFKREGTTWSEIKKITASDAEASDAFGTSVSLSGDYAIVGAQNEDPGGIGNAGAAYIFKRDGTTWSEIKKIQASDKASNDKFGWSVSLSGDYAIVGARGKDTNTGAAYIYTRNGTTWSQQQKIQASDKAADDYFGTSVSLSGDYAIVGANGKDTFVGAAYIYTRNGTTWSQQQKIEAIDIGAGDRFGQSVSLNDTGHAIVGAHYKDTNTGAAYIYPLKEVTNYYITQPGTYRADLQICGIDYKTNEVEVTGSVTPTKSWKSNEDQIVYASDGSANNNFGRSCAMWGSYMVVGSFEGESNTQGAIYIYKKESGTWTFKQKISGEGANDYFSGYGAVDIHEDTIIVGAYKHGTNDNTGKAYIYTRSGETWSLESSIVSDDLATDDKFGISVSVHGDYAVVGAQLDDGPTNSGAGYIFYRNGTSWSQQQKLNPGADDENVGTHVSIYGDYVVLSGKRSGSDLRGRAHVYKRSGTTWGNHTVISNPNPASNDLFSERLSLTDGYVAIGSDADDPGGTSDAGQVYVFKHSGTNDWTLEATLEASDKTSGMRFASGISMTPNVLVVGAHQEGTGGANAGAVYIYERSGTSWTEVKKVVASDAASGDRLGYYVGVNNDGLSFVAGAYGESTNGASAGAAYVYEKTPIAGLTFDNYNKLSLTNTPTYTSSKLAYYSNVYDIGTLTSDITIEKQGEYASLTFDTSSNVAYFSNVTVGAIGSTQKDYALEQILYGTHNSDSPSQGGFGHYIDTNGDGTRFVLGIGMDPTTGQYDGRVKVYHLESGTWTLKVDLASPNTASQRFGDSVCMNEDGTRIVVNHYPSDVQTSRAYIYDYASGAWPTTPTATIIGGVTSFGEGDMDMNKAGTVIVFGSRASGTQIWSRAGDGTWSETKNWGNGFGGYGVAINGAGTRIVTGKESTGEIFEGNYEGGSWGSLTSVIDTSYTSWPAKIRMDSDGTTLIVNADPATEAGIYERQSGTSWTLSQSILSMASYYSRNGLSISYDGNMILVGDMTNDTDGNNFGRAFLWNKSGGSWSLTKTFSNPKTSPAVNDYWGAGVAIAKNTKDRLIIGMSADSTAGTEYGSVYVHTNAIPDYISFDTYNKLSLSGITNPTSKLHALPTGAESTTTYDIGTATNIYIESEGTYTAEMKGSDAFALDSNVTGSLTTPSPNSQLYYPLTSEPSANIWSSTTDVAYGSDGVTFNSTSSTFGLEFTVPTSGIFTVSCNFMKTSFTTNAGVIIASSTNQNSPELESNFTATSYAWRSTNTGYVNTTGLTHYTNQWYHMVWVHDKNNGLTAYLDGVEVYSYSGTIGSPQTSFIVGPNYRSGTITNQFGAGGKMSDIRIYHTAISSTEAELIYKADNKYIPSLNFDTYNKLTFSGLESGSTSTLKYGSNTYSIGTASNVYISEQGTYEAESKGTTTFALTKNVVGAIQTHPDAAYANYRSIGAISAASTSLHNENITTTYSVTMWAKSASGTYIVRTANSDTSSNPTNTHGIFGTDSTGKVTIPSWTSNNSISAEFNGTSVRDEWHFFGFEFEGSSIKLHLDGAVPISSTTAYTGQTHNRMRFDSPSAFTGGSRLAEFAVYNRALTDAEFVSIYNNGKPNGPDNVSSGRVSWFKCLSGAMATNSGSGGDFDATITEDTDVPDSWKYTPPSLTHDGYKLVVKNITPTSTTLKYGSNTYEIGTATNIYVENTGDYSAEIGNATDFALVSNTVSGTIKTVEPGFASRYQGSMALTYDGKLYAWGMNDDGEAGVGTSSDITVPTLCTGITQGTVAKLLSGSDLTDNSRGEVSYVKTIDGKIYATGKGDNFVIPGTTSDLTSFTDVTSYFGDQSLTANTVTMMSFTQMSGAALTETGNVWTWGTHDSTNKALGQAGASSSSTPKQINFYPSVSVGDSIAWDSGAGGQWQTSGAVFYKVSGVNSTQITIRADVDGSASQGTSLTYVKNTGYWNDTLQPSDAPHQLTSDSTWANTTSVQVSDKLYVWNGEGALLGALIIPDWGFSSSWSTTPTITKVTCGSVHSLALDSSGDVWFWGKNTINSDSWPSSITDEPQKVVDGKNIIGLASSYGTMYAWDATGKMWNAGNNWEGQIGDGTTTSNTTGKTLTEVTYFSSNGITINKVYGGGYFVFADTSDGYYCWGSGGHGVFGNGSTGNITSGPAKWTNVSNIKKFMASTQHTTAITEDGKYYAWGRDYHGGRGDSDSSSDITYPKYIDSLPNILAPSFEFDGYDKVFVNNPPSGKKFTYIFEVAVASYDTTILCEVSASGYTIKESDITVLVGTNQGTEKWVNGIVLNDACYVASEASVATVGTKLFTIETDVDVTSFTIGTQKPKYMPGWKIYKNGVAVLTEGSNRGSSSSPEPVSYGYSLGGTGQYNTDWDTKYTKDTHTYDTNQAQIVTVSDPGTYDAQIKGTTPFVLKSATIPATKTSGLYTWAFHHGNFDNAYGDGDILTARDNGRFYADTPAYTGDIGVITPVNPLVSSNVSFRLNEYTQNDSSDTNTTGIMLTEIDVFDDTNTAMTYGTDYRADLYRAAYADNSTDGGSGKLSDETTPYNDDGSRLNDNTLVGSGGYIGWVNGTYNASATGINRKYPYSVDDELIRLVPLTGKIIGKVQFAYKGTGTTPGWKVYRGTTLVETTNYAGTDINTQGNQTTHQIADTVSSTTYTFTPASTLTANVMMVAGGGGGGGRYNCGGGGAGGLVYTAGTTLSGTKTIVVGNGDSGGNGGGQSGLSGKDTTFTGITSAVGGGGGHNQNNNGISGGSGGGGGGGEESNYSQGGTGGSGTANQGNDGGGGLNATTHGGGGGGGAGSAGTTATGSGTSGNGGTGKFFGTGSSFTNFGDEYGEGGYFAGGGGGGKRSGGSYGIPGRGGGGYGQPSGGYMAQSGSQHGMVHTGGGGGGGGNTNTDAHSGYDGQGVGGVRGHGGRGGSGIVLIQTNVAPPNGANTAVVQVGNPRRRSLPPAVSYMGSEVNRFYIIDGASMPEYRLPTHWYADPNSSNSTNVPVSQGSHSLQKRADGGTSNVWYQTSSNYFAEYGNKMAQSADAIFMPVEQQRYDVLLSIGSNGQHDIQLEMAADGTAKLYRNNGATLLQAGTIKCFTVGKWHHIALTVDSEHNAVGYVNGHPVVSTTYTSNYDIGSRGGNMHMRVGVNATFRKFLTYEVSTYNFHMSPKQVLQRAAEVGLGPKLEYDGLNAINVVNTEPGSGTEITIYESNVNDTSNLYVVSCNESSYLLSNAGTYYAQIKGTDTFTITRPLTVTDDHFPLYQYPPVVTGTKSSLTTSLSADTWNTWTMSGASTGNGQYQAKTSHATNAPGGTHATAAGLFTNGIKIEIISDGGASIYPFLHTSQLTNFDITLQLPSAKIIRKYVLYPADTNAPVSTPGGSVDPTLPGNGSEENTRRPKSWVLKGSNDDTSWTTIHTVTNQPPSIYGDVHSISSPASYQYYQLSISANNGSSQFLILGEWQLWGDA